ncbi:MAG TPA: hypothetical protein VFG64_01555 [Dongiaceae bacterium]|nr:hypothetical protein [Dongiaceae bacterium]
MNFAHFPQYNEAWVRKLIEAEIVSARAEPLKPEVDRALAKQLHRARELAPQVVKHLPSHATTTPLWKRFRRWLRSRERRRVSNFLAPQREFNTILIGALLGHIQSMEARVLAVEETQRRCLRELSLLRQHLVPRDDAEKMNQQMDPNFK